MADLDRSDSDRNPPPTTTISTIAVQSGNTKIVIALLQVSIVTFSIISNIILNLKKQYSHIRLFLLQRHRLSPNLLNVIVLLL